MAGSSEPDLEYIKTSGVGKVMAQALGNMYRARPKFPVDFLAKWLDNYCFQRQFEQKLDSGEVSKEEQHKKFLKDLEERRKAQKELEDKQAAQNAEFEVLKTKIKEEEAHETLIAESIPVEIFKRVDLTGVYVGLYAPRKSTEAEEVEEGGDADHEIPSYVLQYIGGDAESMVKSILIRNYSKAKSYQRDKGLPFKYLEKRMSKLMILRAMRTQNQSKMKTDVFIYLM